MKTKILAKKGGKDTDRSVWMQKKKTSGDWVRSEANQKKREIATKQVNGVNSLFAALWLAEGKWKALVDDCWTSQTISMKKNDFFGFTCRLVILIVIWCVEQSASSRRRAGQLRMRHIRICNGRPANIEYGWIRVRVNVFVCVPVDRYFFLGRERQEIERKRIRMCELKFNHATQGKQNEKPKSKYERQDKSKNRTQSDHSAGSHRNSFVVNSSSFKLTIGFWFEA